MIVRAFSLTPSLKLLWNKATPGSACTRVAAAIAGPAPAESCAVNHDIVTGNALAAAAAVAAVAAVADANAAVTCAAVVAAARRLAYSVMAERIGKSPRA